MDVSASSLKLVSRSGLFALRHHSLLAILVLLAACPRKDNSTNDSPESLLPPEFPAISFNDSPKALVEKIERDAKYAGAKMDVSLDLEEVRDKTFSVGHSSVSWGAIEANLAKEQMAARELVMARQLPDAQKLAASIDALSDVTVRLEGGSSGFEICQFEFRSARLEALKLFVGHASQEKADAMLAKAKKKLDGNKFSQSQHGPLTLCYWTLCKARMGYSFQYSKDSEDVTIDIYRLKAKDVKSECDQGPAL